jgi:hypothetical protein
MANVSRTALAVSLSAAGTIWTLAYAEILRFVWHDSDCGTNCQSVGAWWDALAWLPVMLMVTFGGYAIVRRRLWPIAGGLLASSLALVALLMLHP